MQRRVPKNNNRVSVAKPFFFFLSSNLYNRNFYFCRTILLSNIFIHFRQKFFSIRNINENKYIAYTNERLSLSSSQPSMHHRFSNVRIFAIRQLFVENRQFIYFLLYKNAEIFYNLIHFSYLLRFFTTFSYHFIKISNIC